MDNAYYFNPPSSGPLAAVVLHLAQFDSSVGQADSLPPPFRRRLGCGYAALLDGQSRFFHRPVSEQFK
jgi:hypothetical protein